MKQYTFAEVPRMTSTELGGNEAREATIHSAGGLPAWVRRRIRPRYRSTSTSLPGLQALDSHFFHPAAPTGSAAVGPGATRCAAGSPGPRTLLSAAAFALAEPLHISTVNQFVRAAIQCTVAQRGERVVGQLEARG